MPRLGLPEDGTIPVLIFLSHSHTANTVTLFLHLSFTVLHQPILCPAQGYSKVETEN